MNTATPNSVLCTNDRSLVRFTGQRADSFILYRVTELAISLHGSLTREITGYGCMVTMRQKRQPVHRLPLQKCGVYSTVISTPSLQADHTPSYLAAKEKR